MSNQTTNVPSVTLQTAVLMQVKEFAENNTTFSVHDVTRNIRTKVYSGNLEVPETEVAGASFRHDIPHTKVKAIFDELWRTGVFDPILTLSRNFNGTYFEYTPQLVSTNPTPVVATPAVTYTALASTPAISYTAPADNDIKSRIVTYLTNCKKKNFRPSLKHVQSAIKRDVTTGWTCEQIKDYIVNTLTVQVIDDPDYVSASQVATV